VNAVPTAARNPGGPITVSVVTADGALPVYRRAAGSRPYVAAVPGQSYVLRVRNLTGGRIEIISTVDGRNTLKDEPGDIRASQGLVFGAFQRADFTGWRVDNEQTREFIFGVPERSVAAQATGSVSNVGLIGFAVYREQTYAEQYRSYRAGPFPGATYAGNMMSTSVTAVASAGDAGPDEPVAKLGTGIGAYQADRVTPTTFTRTGEPDVLVIGYDTIEALRAAGIVSPAGPSAFPGSGTGYERYEAP
jgi:hypothetical protein